MGSVRDYRDQLASQVHKALRLPRRLVLKTSWSDVLTVNRDIR